MDTRDLLDHCRELDRCNQRGGRMLSLPDLVAAGTLDLDLAAFLMSRVYSGASFMVGARPGGAGKTTVMCALLNGIGQEYTLVAATSQAVRAAPRPVDGKLCYICHEIGAGHWFAYLWGADLREYCSLSRHGHMLATNLHADDIDEARDQVCLENGVTESDFRSFKLLIFLKVAGHHRLIEKVYQSDGACAHRLVFANGEGLARDLAAQDFEKYKSFLQECLADRAYTIDAVRKRIATLHI